MTHVLQFDRYGTNRTCRRWLKHAGAEPSIRFEALIPEIHKRCASYYHEASLTGDIISAERRGADHQDYDQPVWSCPDLPARRGVAPYATSGAYASSRDTLRTTGQLGPSGLPSQAMPSEGRHCRQSGTYPPLLSSPGRAAISDNYGPGRAAGG